MYRMLVLVTALTLAACGSSDTKAIAPTNNTIMPQSALALNTNPTSLPDSAFLPPLDTTPLVCIGQQPTVQFDRWHTVIRSSSFPLTLSGTYEGCTKRVYAYFNFYPDGGGLEPYVVTPIEVEDTGHWRATLATPPGTGTMFFNVRAQNAVGEDEGAGIEFTIDAH